MYHRSFSLVLVCFLSVSNAAGFPNVTTPNGILKGKYMASRNGNTYEAYLGIRYGVIPSRFEISEASPSWDGTKDATEYGTPCPQSNIVTGEPIGEEDCLSLNVYTPKADNKKRPVLLFIHGGGFIFGSSDGYGGKYFVDEEIVLITVNYRIGILGFLNTRDGLVSGNMGLKDQVLSLRWIQENIEAFGGDATRVTISGESAGAASVMHLVLSPTTKGLFQHAIAQSGTALNPWAYAENTLPRSMIAGKSLNCSTVTTAELVACFKVKTVAEILRAQLIFTRFHIDPMVVWPPSLEIRNARNPEPFLEDSPSNIIKAGKFHRIPILMTVNREEGSLFHAQVILRTPSLLEQLDKEWQRIAPITLWFDLEPELKPRSNEVAKKIRQFYFGNDEINIQKEENLTNLYTDSWFLKGIHETALLLAKHTTVYTGLITHQRKDWNIFSLFGINEHLALTAHGEDLSYLYNGGNPNAPSPFVSEKEVLEPDDVEFSKAFVKTLASFVASGVPKVAVAAKPKWTPVTEQEIKSGYLNFLNIGLDPYLHVNPFPKRIDFWKNLYTGDQNVVKEGL